MEVQSLKETLRDVQQKSEKELQQLISGFERLSNVILAQEQCLAMPCHADMPFNWFQLAFSYVLSGFSMVFQCFSHLFEALSSA